MKRLAIIPARGGSKRIPRKNIKVFLGKPIIAYSIETAIQSNLFDEVMVSTDDDEIAQIAKKYNAKVPFIRSATNSDDQASTIDVLQEVLSYYQNNNFHYDQICCLYPAAPFITTPLLIKAEKLMVKNNFDSAYPVIEFGHPVQRGLYINDTTNRIKYTNPEIVSSRSQELRNVYYDAGQFYWFKSDALNKNIRLDSINSGALVISEMHAHDIDTLEDWKIAEYKYRYSYL